MNMSIVFVLLSLDQTQEVPERAGTPKL